MEKLAKLLFFFFGVFSVGCFPSKQSLNDRPSELTWQAWLLLDSQNQLQNESDRRITPKSVFIAPKLGQRNDSLPDCADGYRADSMGRCIKFVKVDETAHLNFLLSRLNEMYAQNSDEDFSEESEENIPTAGPLQVNIPFGETLGDKEDADTDSQENQKTPEMSPSSNGKFENQLNKRHQNPNNPSNIEEIPAVPDYDDIFEENTEKAETTTTQFDETTTVESTEETTPFETTTWLPTEETVNPGITETTTLKEVPEEPVSPQKSPEDDDLKALFFLMPNKTKLQFLTTQNKDSFKDDYEIGTHRPVVANQKPFQEDLKVPGQTQGLGHSQKLGNQDSETLENSQSSGLVQNDGHFQTFGQPQTGHRHQQTGHSQTGDQIGHLTGNFQTGGSQSGSFQTGGSQHGHFQNEGTQKGHFQTGGSQSGHFQNGGSQSGHFQTGGSQTGNFQSQGLGQVSNSGHSRPSGNSQSGNSGTSGSGNSQPSGSGNFQTSPLFGKPLIHGFAQIKDRETVPVLTFKQRIAFPQNDRPQNDKPHEIFPEDFREDDLRLPTIKFPPESSEEHKSSEILITPNLPQFQSDLPANVNTKPHYGPSHGHRPSSDLSPENVQEMFKKYLQRHVSYPERPQVPQNVYNHRNRDRTEDLWRLAPSVPKDEKRPSITYGNYPQNFYAQNFQNQENFQGFGRTRRRGNLR